MCSRGLTQHRAGFGSPGAFAVKERTMTYDVYLAGPFFNTAQIELIARAEAMIRGSGHRLFSPREHPANGFAEKLHTTEERAAFLRGAADGIFESNLVGMAESRHMIAVLDYLLPTDLALLLARPIGDGGNIRFPFGLPDTGTVWEMGYFQNFFNERSDLDEPIDLEFQRVKAKPRRQIIGFTTRPREKAGTLNLMLTQCCRGVLFGWEELEQFLGKDTMDFNWSVLQKWNGGVC